MEMESYVPSETSEPKKKKGKKGKKEKDPNKPKRGLSAYMFFGKEVRADVIAKECNGNGSKVTDVMKGIAARWAKLDAKDKEKFERLSAQDKERYEKEIAEYKKNNGGDDDDDDDEEEAQRPYCSHCSPMEFCSSTREACVRASAGLRSRTLPLGVRCSHRAAQSNGSTVTQVPRKIGCAHARAAAQSKNGRGWRNRDHAARELLIPLPQCSHPLQGVFSRRHAPKKSQFCRAFGDGNLSLSQSESVSKIVFS